MEAHKLEVSRKPVYSKSSLSYHITVNKHVCCVLSKKCTEWHCLKCRIRDGWARWFLSIPSMFILKEITYPGAVILESETS